MESETNARKFQISMYMFSIWDSLFVGVFVQVIDQNNHEIILV